VEDLEELMLDSNGFDDSEFFANFSTLKRLSLANNGITEFEIPASLRGLRSLNLEQNELSELSPLHEMTSLVELNLRGNQFSSFALPSTIRELRNLDLSANQLTQIELPDELDHLLELDLSDNLLAQVELPAGLTELRRLYLGGNLLSGLQLPESATQLSRLDLVGNPELVEAVSLPEGWLEVPNSISSLWVRFCYHVPVHGCGHGHGWCGGNYGFEYFGTFHVAGLERGEDTWTLHFRNADVGTRFYVERSADLINWVGAEVAATDHDARIIQIAHSGAETEFFRARPSSPASEKHWTYWWPRFPRYHAGCE
jgi:hypothetical protein